MPGMQSFGGRIAWGGVELAGVFLIHKLDSRVGRIVAWVFSAVHVALAIHNVSTGRGLRRHLAVSVSF